MSQPSVISGLQRWMRAPKTAFRGCCQPLQWLLRRWGNARSNVNRKTRLAPDGWGAYESSEISEPRGLRLPMHRMLNSLTWYLIFDVQTDPLFVANLVSPPASLQQFSQSYCDVISQARSPKYSHQIKQVPTFRLWLYFLFNIHTQTHIIEYTVCLLSRDQLFATPWAVAHQAPLSVEFPTGVGCHILLQGIFRNQRSNSHRLCLLHWQADSLPLHHLETLGAT